MIEIVQQATKTEENIENKLPKNIRQIGNPEKDFRIYMEDYVYTYLHPAQLNGMETEIFPRLLILLGEINHFSNRSCAFVSGAIQVEDSECPDILPDLNERTWRKIHREMQQFFENCDIVGWVLDIPGNTLEITEEMEEIHRRNFVSQYQFFFLMDSKEREEAFFTWKSGRLTKKEGYFIYYEKNPQMQEYMISKREALFGEAAKSEEVNDRAAIHYRTMMMAKKECAGKQKTGFLSYLTSMLTIIVLCAVSVILLGNIQKMENMEQTISVMSTVIESTEQETEPPENQVAVETISGNILPIDELETVKTENQNQAETKNAVSEENTTSTENTALESNIPNTEIEAPESNVESTENKVPEGNAAPKENVASEENVTPEESLPEENASQKDAGETVQPVMSEAETYRTQGYYIVQQGDSLRQICYKIYETYSMIDKLCEANGIDNQDFIYVGQKIVLP